MYIFDKSVKKMLKEQELKLIEMYEKERENDIIIAKEQERKRILDKLEETSDSYGNKDSLYGRHGAEIYFSKKKLIDWLNKKE